VSPSVDAIFQKTFPFYEFVDVNLEKSPGVVDKSLDAILILQPTHDFSESALEAIDRFAMTGKGLAVFVSAVNVAAGQPKMTAYLDSHGINRLLRQYGVVIDEKVVCGSKPLQFAALNPRAYARDTSIHAGSVQRRCSRDVVASRNCCTVYVSAYTNTKSTAYGPLIPNPANGSRRKNNVEISSQPRH
jgi:hypothetical protein